MSILYHAKAGGGLLKPLTSILHIGGAGYGDKRWSRWRSWRAEGDCGRNHKKWEIIIASTSKDCFYYFFKLLLLCVSNWSRDADAPFKFNNSKVHISHGRHNFEFYSGRKRHNLQLYLPSPRLTPEVVA